MRVVYLTIDNINDNVILAQTLPFLGRLAELPGVEDVDVFALRKNGGERYRDFLPAAVRRVRIGTNHGIWHPLTWLHLVRFACGAWRQARGATVLIGRNPVSLLCLLPAALRRRARLVLDSRGILSEEYVLQGKIAKRGRMHRLLRGLERWAIRRADAILCVSEHLRQRICRWQPAAAEKVFVIPCCYDPGIMRRDDAAIERLRGELGFDPSQDFVLVYAGSLSAWNRPDAILASFRAFREVYSRTQLLLLTGDHETAQKTFGEDEVIIRSVPHDEIQHYLALADLGLLLRDRGPVNRVASPVKFAEYLACGVPVLVSPGVGDCPDIVRREGVGYVLDADRPLSRIVSEVRAGRSDFRVRCREAAMRYFDGDAYADRYAEMAAGKSAPRAGTLQRKAAALCLVVAAIGVGWLALAVLAQGPPLRVLIEEPFNHGLNTDAVAVAARGFRPTARGFGLRAGEAGELTVRMRSAHPLTPWSAITLQWFGGGSGMESRVELLASDGPRVLLENRSAAGTRIPLPASVAGKTEVVFRFRARNGSGEERLVLDKLVLQAWEGPPPGLPALPWVAAVGLTTVLGLGGLSARPRRALLVGAVLLIALLARYANLGRVDLAPLDPDAQGYRAYARQLTLTGPHGFYSGSFDLREPLYPAAVKLALWAFGDADRSLRLLSLLLSAGVVYQGYRVARGPLGFSSGLGAGLLLALSVPLVVESGRGLRLELETVLFVGTAWLLFAGRLTSRRALSAGVLAGALALTRFPYAATLLLLFALAAWWHRHRRRRAWGGLAAAVLVMVVMVLPHRLALLAQHGDAFYDVHRTLHWIVNQEFQGRQGFPSVAEVARDPFTGPPVTARRYYLELHAPGEVAWRSLRGLGRAIFNLAPVGYRQEVRAVLGIPVGWLDLPLVVLGILGLGVLSVRKEAGWIPPTLLLGLLHVAFAYDLDLPDYRFRMILQGAPFFAVAVMAGVRGCVDAGRTGVFRRRRLPGSPDTASRGGVS